MTSEINYLLRNNENHFGLQQISEVDATSKLNENKAMNSSGDSIVTMGNSLERKISVEEKRSVTNSHKANSSGSSQLNDSGKSISSTEHHQQNNSIGDLQEEDETLYIDNDDNARCSLM